MLRARSWLPAASVVLGVAAHGCNAEVEPAIVNYGDGTAVGRWEPEASADRGFNTLPGAGTGGSAAYSSDASGAGDALSPLDPGSQSSSGSTMAAAGRGSSSSGGDGGSDAAAQGGGGTSGNGSVDAGDAGTASAGGSASMDPGTGGTSASDSGMAGVGGNATGPGGAGADAGVVDPPMPTVSSLTFQVTTSQVGNGYQPKNIGAIWVEDSGGGLVKTLEVWAATRRRYLTGYAGAIGSSGIDVTTSATLPRHTAHTVTWDLRDRNGAAVSPGQYAIVMELTDGNRTGRSNSVTFDTSAGPATLSPADVPSFGGMQLSLE